MGRRTFGTLLEEERASYRQTRGPTPLSRSYPLRALAQTLAAAEDVQRRSMRYEGDHVLALGATDSRSPSLSTTEPVDRMQTPSTPSFAVGTTTAGSRSPSPSTTEPFDRMQTPNTPSFVVDGSVPDARFDYRGRRLVELVMADIARSSAGPTTFRYAVTDPSRGPCLRRDDDVLLIGMLHHPARVFKNHGVAHKHFAVESEPNTLYTGAAVEVQILMLPYMDEMDWVPGNPCSGILWNLNPKSDVGAAVEGSYVGLLARISVFLTSPCRRILRPCLSNKWFSVIKLTLVL
ncbi:hypothetical protein C8F04DRAFT_1177963 [Mycena alexandri]|uniref:Uncharacterized protein n=1 Tax=Mycena alexandri TaxID=1745969 RepID=A0AAD6XA96_9AGAR|nr:hypothetical protein C8F04DRAFT_1177963 [Mycena alexandri]